MSGLKLMTRLWPFLRNGLRNTGVRGYMRRIGRIYKAMMRLFERIAYWPMANIQADREGLLFPLELLL
jgi:hypothetical protein